MTNTDDNKRVAAHTPEPWDYDTGFLVAPDPRGQHPDIYIAEIVQDDDESRIAPYEQLEANARRICAAVNACQGIGTEALEHGVISELRQVVGEIVTAASNLDAAIDGSTNQFDAERARLDAAIRIAHSVLDDGSEISMQELLAGRKQIAAIWSIEDVLSVRPDLTNEQAWQVLRDVDRRHDAENGINWTTLEIIADELFGPALETTNQEEK